MYNFHFHENFCPFFVYYKYSRIFCPVKGSFFYIPTKAHLMDVETILYTKATEELTEEVEEELEKAKNSSTAKASLSEIIGRIADAVKGGKHENKSCSR